MTPPSQPRRLSVAVPKARPLIDAQTFQLLMDRLRQQDETMDEIRTTVNDLAADVAVLKAAQVIHKRVVGLMQRCGYGVAGAGVTVGLTVLAHALHLI